MDFGMPDIKKVPSTNGLQPQSLGKSNGTVPQGKSGPAWDEDWGPTTTRRSSASSQSSINTSTQRVSVDRPSQVSTLESSVLSALSSQQNAVSCTAVDIEWPPRPSSATVPQSGLGDDEQQINAGESSTPSFDDIDPFANWPPRTSGSGILSNGNIGGPTSNYGSGSISSGANTLYSPPSTFTNSWSSNGQNSWEPQKSSQESSNSNTSVLVAGSSMNSIRNLKQNQVSSLGGTAFTDQKPMDLGSIFSSTKNETPVLKLAPPPTTVVGRGRGRGRGATLNSRSQPKQTIEQPPLLDLL